MAEFREDGVAIARSMGRRTPVQIITKRNVAAGHSFAASLLSLLVLGAAGCIGVDDLDVCLGRGCAPSGGAAGFGGASGGTAGGQGTGANAADAGVEPPDDTTPDAAVDAAPTEPSGQPCEVAFISPVADGAGDAWLVAADDLDEAACGLTFTASVAVDTNASSVRLFVNENPVGVQPVTAGAAVFDVVLGNRQDTPNTLSAEAIMPDGTTCSASFGGDVFVDCAGPSCSVTSPLATRDGFLSSTHDADSAAAGLQTEILVQTESAHSGQLVRLAIDGILDVVEGEGVQITGGVGRATFGAVTLDEGLRTLRAECEDADGAVTASEEVEWDVDVTACGVSLEALAGGADPLTALHDLDSNSSNGLQLLLRGEVTGDDCRSVGFGVCGLTLAELPLGGAPGDGSFSAPITLAHQTGAIELCAEVEDQAGNRSDPQVTLGANVRSSAPAVAIASPSSGARFNVAGSGGGIADSEPSSAASCETDVSVDCTDIGHDVQLLVNGSVVGAAACTAFGGLAPPFAGRATFSGVSLPTQNDGVSTATLSARQTLAGLTGVSTQIVVQADCEAPSCSITRPEPSSLLTAADDTSGEPDFQTSIEVRTDVGGIGQSVRLTLDGDEPSSLLSTAVAAGNGATATFLDVTLTDRVHSAQAECQDLAGNVETSAVATWSIDATPCTATLTVAGGAFPITPLSDLEGGAAGLQVIVAGHALETDCVSARVAVCGAATGAFTPLDGAGNFALGLTLDAVTADVEVCAELTDEAGNVGVSRAAVSVRVDAPSVQIVSPSAGARFDAASGCAAAVAVTCPDVGAPVELFVDALFVDEQPCVAPGVAVFPVSLGTKNDGSPTELSARQTADGLTGPFSTLSVQADCEPPVLSFAEPGCPGVLELASADLDFEAPGLQLDVNVLNGGVPEVTLTVTRDGASVVLGSAGDLTSTAFPSTTLGGLGNVSLEACATDPQGNRSCTPSCELIIAAPPELALTSPLAGDVLTSASADCDAVSPGLEVAVTGTTDAADGSDVAVSFGLGAVANTSVSGGAFSACAAAPHGDGQTLTATVTDAVTALSASTSLALSVDTQAPGSILAASVEVTGRREGTLTLSWSSVLDTDGDTLAAYRLRCARTDIVDEVGWANATDIPVSIAPSPVAGSVETLALDGIRTGTTRFCVVRGEDDHGQLSALQAGLGAVVANPFLSQEYAVADDSASVATIGTVTVEPLGDINGDGIADFASGVVNATTGGSARIFFGADDLDADLGDVDGPDLTITRTVNTTSGFGGEVSGLGDVSGDGVPDFAVSARAPTINTVYIFFGRDSGDAPWPASIDVSTGCAADVCIVGSAVATNGGLFGWDVHGANFDGAGVNDVVISARTASGVALGAGRVYVILGGEQLATGGTRTIPANAATTNGEPDGFIIDPPAARAHFGFSVAALDNGASPDDLLIGANGFPPVGSQGSLAAVFFLAGRAYPAATGSGLLVIGSSELVQVDTGVVGNHGNPVRALGDFDGDGAGDFAIGHDYAANGAARVFLRAGLGGAFSNQAPFVLDFTNTTFDDNYGLYIASGEHTGLGLLGDLDNDGLGELLVGADDPDGSGASVFGSAQLFYGAASGVGRDRSAADFAYTSTRGQVVPNFVGDVNADGFNDVALLDSGFGANALFILY